MNKEQLKKMCKRVLEKEDYKIVINDTKNKFNIDDIVICFSNGKKWHIVSLDVMLAFPVLYYDFISPKDGNTYVNSLLVCPLTLRSIIYKGRIQILDVSDERLFIKNLDTDDEFYMDLPYTGHYDEKGNEKKIKSQIKRHQVKILKLKDCFTIITDPTYIIVDEFKETIIDKKYYSNVTNYNNDNIICHYHPKTLVYITQHFSHIDNSYKYNIVVGVDVSQEEITGYNFIKSGFWFFFDNYKDNLMKKKAYIYPMFLFSALKMYKNAKIIYLK